MKYLQENMDFLKKTMPGVYQRMINADFADEADLNVRWDDNKRMLQVSQENKEIWLGSTFDSKREADRLFTLAEDKASFLLVFGVGNYKIFREIKRHFKYLRRVVIFEPSKKVFQAFIENVSFKKTFSIFGDMDLSFVITGDIDEIKNYYLSYSGGYVNDDASIICSISYRQLFPNLLFGLNKFVAENFVTMKVSSNTVRHFSYIWLINQWRNLAVNSIRVDFLSQLAKELPVIIVAAGPSLKNNIHLLKDIGNRAIIISVGSATRILHNHGIVPHLRAALDGGALEEKVFADIDGDECPLLYSPTMYFETLKSYGKNLIQFNTYRANPLLGLIYRMYNISFVETSTGSSVANTIVFLWLALGCKKIILMGQDLCFTGDKMYAQGSWTSKELDEEIVSASNKVKVLDMYGKEVYTEPVYLTMKKIFEDITIWHKNCEFINATEGGLRLKGYEHKRLSVVIENDLPAETVDIRKFIKESVDNYPNSDLAKNIDLSVKEGVKVLKGSLEALKKEIEKLNSIVENDISKRDLIKIEKQYKSICNTVIYRRLVENIFSIEEVAINEALRNMNFELLKEKIAAFSKVLGEYVDYSIFFAEEFLSQEEKVDIVYQI